MLKRVRLSASEARRVALAAQGFDRERPDCSPDARHFKRVLAHTGLLQLDFVNVLMPAHYLVVWSRLGAYQRQRLEAFLYQGGRFTEQWAHEASIVPVAAWSRLAHRRQRWTPHNRNPVHTLDEPERYLERVLRHVEEAGASSADQVPQAPAPGRRPGDWHRPMARWALEYHFARGDLAVHSRKANFQRLYELPERVIPLQQLERKIGENEARAELLEQAAVSLGIATLQDLADYFRMSPREARPEIDRLEKSGRLKRVSVQDWPQDAYLHVNARLPRSVRGASLISPFDPLVWFRPRAERLFGFEYRIEIYVPEAKRRWGYYVLPFRLDDRLVARVDLKADRNAGSLLVRRAWLEAQEDARTVASALAAELSALAQWLALEHVLVDEHCDFARTLAKHRDMLPMSARAARRGC